MGGAEFFGAPFKLEGKVNTELHSPVAGVHVLLAQKVFDPCTIYAVNGTLRDYPCDAGRCGTGRESISESLLGLRREDITDGEPWIRVVKNVVNLPSELQPFVLAQTEALVQREVEVGDSRPDQNIASRASGYKTLTSPGNGECRTGLFA